MLHLLDSTNFHFPLLTLHYFLIALIMPFRHNLKIVAHIDNTLKFYNFMQNAEV